MKQQQALALLEIQENLIFSLILPSSSQSCNLVTLICDAKCLQSGITPFDVWKMARLPNPAPARVHDGEQDQRWQGVAGAGSRLL